MAKKRSEKAAPQPKKKQTGSGPEKANPLASKKIIKKNNTPKATPAKSKKSLAIKGKEVKAKEVNEVKAKEVKGKKEELKKPSLRSIYSNSRNTLMPLGFGSDFKTKKCVVIFSDLLTGQVHTTALSVWNRLKLKQVKDLNPQT